MNLYQATAIYDDSEIGYGESETRADAINDCLSSIGDTWSRSFPQLVTIEVRHGNAKKVLTLRKAEDIVAASNVY